MKKYSTSGLLISTTAYYNVVQKSPDVAILSVNVHFWGIPTLIVFNLKKIVRSSENHCIHVFIETITKCIIRQF